jgi:hypothetical protein
MDKNEGRRWPWSSKLISNTARPASVKISETSALFLTIALRDNGRQEQRGIWQLKSDGDFSFEAFAFEQPILSQFLLALIGPLCDCLKPHVAHSEVENE